MIYGRAVTEIITVSKVRTGCLLSFVMTAGDVLRKGQVKVWRSLGELKRAMNESSVGAVVSSKALNS